MGDAKKSNKRENIFDKLFSCFLKPIEAVFFLIFLFVILTSIQYVYSLAALSARKIASKVHFLGTGSIKGFGSEILCML